MWFKKQEDDLKLPKLPPEKREKTSMNLFRQSFKKVELPERKQEPELLHRIDVGEKVKKIEPEFYFWLCDGRVVKDVKELTKAMRDMKEDVFKFHVNDYKNDFSNWVRDIVKNERLANEINKAKTREQAYELLSGKKLKRKKLRALTKRKRDIAARELNIAAPPEPPRIVRTGGPIEEQAELQELPQEPGELGALKAEEEAFEKIEDVIEHPETLLPYQGKIIPKPKKEKIKRIAKTKKIKDVKKTVKKPRLKVVAKINKIVEEAEHFMNQGDARSARNLINKARPLLRKASIPKQDKKKLNYKVLDIEAKAKLFMLS